ncbi:hypothetical protein KTO58_26520 [Chitinophaga pendula]|uniref:hypothetical protein n=1 Tax=Chitinophaga TaxID=79328 RepID=UPI000BB073E3|nr:MULTISPECIES: hypothetical protein [Chitinophaga]ASZ09883.1 hypothetical protein CK934_02250 [Chitinophaga sp. MD30]UCJ07176.1 hypothetical protein KTO58_26520 [Chitinophaga pendula]
MRNLLIALSCTVTLLAGCKKEEDGPPRKFISFRLDEKIVLSEKPRALLVPANLTDNDPTNDHTSLVLSGYSYKGELITFTLHTDAPMFVPGVYSSTTAGNTMSVELNDTGLTTLVSDDEKGSLTVRILELKDSTIQASFDAVLEDLYEETPPRSVYNGFFRATMTTKQ